MIRVFVYGTLKNGEPNFHVLSETAGAHRFIGAGRTVNLFPLLIASKYNIPALLAKPGEGHRIHGEIYEVDSKKLEILDELEAYPTLYDRKEEKIEMHDGTFTDAWIYMLREWRDDIYRVSSPLLQSYSSKGDHGREYVDRYVRAKEMIADEEYDFYGDIQGEPKDRVFTVKKAENDCKI